MIEYLYFVKWLENGTVAEEVFEFFEEAKNFALGLLSCKPEIHQTELVRDDFRVCIGDRNLGKVWSWEEVMDDIPEDTEASVFTKGDFDKYADGYDPDNDPEFDDRDITFETDCVSPALDAKPDNFRKPIPEGMTVESLVEAMEENEDTVECKWCNELFDKSECRKEADLGYLCSRCEAVIKSRGETLTFEEGPLTESDNAFTDWTKGEVKYMNKLLDHYEDVAIEHCQEHVDPRDFSDYSLEDERERRCEEDRIRGLFGENFKPKTMLEELEDSDSYRKRLLICPSCNNQGFDPETSICINCGFNLLAEDLDEDRYLSR